MLQIWGTALIAMDARRVLQLAPEDNSRAAEEVQRRFEEWYDLTVDLPGTYYLQVVSWLYQQNRLATGSFVALGRKIDLARLYHPIFLLGARDDEVVAPEQLFATANRVGTPKESVVTASEPCGHLSLFLGADTINGTPGRGSRSGCARSSGHLHCVMAGARPRPTPLNPGYWRVALDIGFAADARPGNDSWRFSQNLKISLASEKTTAQPMKTRISVTARSSCFLNSAAACERLIERMKIRLRQDDERHQRQDDPDIFEHEPSRGRRRRAGVTRAPVRKGNSGRSPTCHAT